MGSWFGPVQLIAVDTTGSSAKNDGDGSAFLPLPFDNIKVVHYPDCQQLIIWLPTPGREYDRIELVQAGNNKITGEWKVTDKLNGAIQLLWDTLDIEPGEYLIRIIRDEQHWHEIRIKKYKEGEEVPEEKKPAELVEEHTGPIVYRDGTGKILEDEDLVLRNTVINDMMDRFSRHIEYDDQGRGGYVIYVEGKLRLSFWYEFGGGKCIASIDIPSKENWEKVTGIPLSRREDIIAFTANTVQSKQAPRSQLRIADTSIEFWER